MDREQHVAGGGHSYDKNQATAMHSAAMAYSQDSLSPGGSVSFCGTPVANTSSLPLLDVAATDRYGNAYSWQQIQIQDSVDIRGRRMPVSNDCGCDEFTNINTGFFEVDFEDCIMMTGVGFADTTDGTARREAVCATLQYLSTLIVPNDSECNPGQARQVNIRVLRSDSDNDPDTSIPEALPNTVLGYASPYYPPYSSYVGVLHPVTWVIINSGEYPDGFDADTYHADMRYNFSSSIIDWHNDYDAPVGNGLYDLYTTVLHEMTHALGFVSAFNSTEGLLGSRSGLGSYYAFDQFLQLTYASGNTENLIENGVPVNGNSMSPEWFFNGMVDAASDLHSSCPGPGPDMTFDGGLGGHPIYTGTSFNSGSSFSHLDAACNAPAGSTIPYLMQPTLSESERRNFLAEELDILGRLGYTINCSVLDTAFFDCSSVDPACNTASVGDNNPENTCDTSGLVLSYQICPGDSSSSVISIPVDSLEALLLHNDPNAQSLAFIEPLFGDNLGTWELSSNGQEYLFTPDNILYFYDFHYAVESCNGAVGNTVRFTISVGPDNGCDLPVCGEDQSCASLDSIIQSWPHCGFRTVDEEQVNADCNIICNGGFGGTWAYEGQNLPVNNGFVELFFYEDFGFISSFAIGSPGEVLPTYIWLPGWVRANGTPDLWVRSQDESHFLHLGGNPQSGNMEGVLIFASTNQNQNYIASFRAEEDLSASSRGAQFRTPLISFISLSDFTPGNTIANQSDPLYTGDELRVFDTELIVGVTSVRRGALVCADDNYNGVWVSGSNQFQESAAIVDNVEIIPDEFTAGDSIFSPLCNQRYFLGGQQFCMLSDVGVEYAWSRVEDDGMGGEQLVQLGTYRVLNGVVVNRTGLIDSSLQVEVAPAITTTYRLTRTIYDYGGLPTDFEFSKEMPDGTIVSLDSDDVTVVVQEGLPDASFTWEETGCGTGIFNLSSNDDDLSTTHAWFLDDGPTPFDTLANPVLGPLASGQYTIRHEATNICGTVSQEETIVVDIPPVPSPVLSIDTIQQCIYVVFEVSNLNPGESIVGYDYGNNTTGTFYSPGTYTAIVTVVNSCGVEGTGSLTFDVGPAPDPDATLVITPTDECGGYTFATGEAHPDFDYSWDFGDGNTSTETSPTHNYGTQGGNFQVTLTLEGECGGVYTYTQSLEVPECLDVDTYTCEDCNTATTIGQAGQTTSLSSILTPGQHSGLLYCVEGTLVIQSGENYSFGNSVFRMGEGARIVIAPTASLLANNTVFHGCSTLWRGIEVLKGGRLALKAGNILSDAQYAVYIHPNPDANGPVTDVSINRNRFVANFVGIYTADEGAGAEADLLIAGNRFDVYASTDELLPPFSGQTSGPEGLPNANLYPLAGIYVQPMASVFASTANSFRRLASGVVIHENPAATASFDAYEEMNAHAAAYPTSSYAFAGDALRMVGTGWQTLGAFNNTVKDCRVGIGVGEAGLTAHSNTIGGAEYGVIAIINQPNFITIGDDNPSLANTVNSSKFGIWASATDPNGQVDIIENTVTTSDATDGEGIVLLFSKGEAEIRGNTVTVNTAGMGIGLLSSDNVKVLGNTVNLNNAALADAGISLYGANQCVIQDNSISGTGTGGTQNEGIRINYSAGNTYCCNTVDNTRYGVSVFGPSMATDKFRGNTFGNHTAGLWLDGTSAILGSQEHTENCWNGSGGAVWSGATGLYAQDFPFLVDPGDMACFEPPTVTPAQGWFQNFDNGNIVGVCSQAACEVEGFNHESPDITKIINGEAGSGSVYANTILWSLSQYLYEGAYGVTTSDTSLQNFLNTHDHTSVGDFYSLKTGLSDLYHANSSDIAAMKSGLNSLVQQLMELALLDQEILAAPDSLWQGLMSSRNTHMDDMQLLAAGIESHSALLAANRTTAAATLKTQNNGISVHAGYEHNRKALFGAFLSYIERGASHFTSTEQSALALIAQQCPLSGGKAVFDARALLSVARDSLVWYDNACTGGQQFRAIDNANPVASAASVELFPNPASGEATVRWGNPLEFEGRLDLYDTLGRLHYSVVLEPGRSEYRLSLEVLEKGLYYVDVKIDSSRSTMKLVVNP